MGLPGALMGQPGTSISQTGAPRGQMRALIGQTGVPVGSFDGQKGASMGKIFAPMSPTKANWGF